MHHKTKGIVLHAVRYSDSSWVVTVFTEQFGRESYMVYGVNKKKSVFRAAFLQPFTLIEMNVSHVPGKEIQQIKDTQLLLPLNDIALNPVKNAIALFLSELLFKTLKVSEPDDMLFKFLENSIQLLEHSNAGVANFHLLFLVKLTRYLGFEPSCEFNDNGVFDLQNGVFATERPPHVHYLSNADSRFLESILRCSFIEMNTLKCDRVLRNRMIDHLLIYYRLHVPDFNGMQSLDVLHELFE